MSEEMMVYLLRNGIQVKGHTHTKKYREIERGIRNSIRLIKKISFKLSKPPILIKTYKHKIGLMDGDIDLIIFHKDVDLFIRCMKNYNFDIKVERKNQFSCTKNNYAKIEPRSSISYLSLEYIDYDNARMNSKKTRLYGTSLLSVSAPVDATILSLGVIYGPRYIDLYLAFLIRKYSTEIGLFSKSINVGDELSVISRAVNKNFHKKFPIFLPITDELKFLIKGLVKGRGVIGFSRALLFFFYSKYRYIFILKVPYEKNWYK